MGLGTRKFVWLAALYGMAGEAAALGALTLLHARLQDPAVMAFDRGIQLRVHGWASPWLTAVMLALTWIGAIKIFATALGVVLIGLMVRGRPHAAALLGFSMAGALGLNETLKLHFHRMRPTVAWAIGDEHTFSFPSGHSLFSVVLYGTLVYLALHKPVSSTRRTAVLVPAVVLPLGIGLSRIYLGMHFPTDVLAGYVVGVMWVATVVVVDRKWRRLRLW